MTYLLEVETQSYDEQVNSRALKFVFLAIAKPQYDASWKCQTNSTLKLDRTIAFLTLVDTCATEFGTLKERRCCVFFGSSFVGSELQLLFTARTYERNNSIEQLTHVMLDVS